MYEGVIEMEVNKNVAGIAELSVEIRGPSHHPNSEAASQRRSTTSLSSVQERIHHHPFIPESPLFSRSRPVHPSELSSGPEPPYPFIQTSNHQVQGAV